MGYKRISSGLHNFAHSFLSLMNYVDGEYIIDLLPKVLRETPGHEIRISLPGGTIEPPRDYPAVFRKSVRCYCNRYQGHFESEHVDVSLLRGVVFVVFADLGGVLCRAEATDDRGKEHSVTVRPT